MNAAFTHVLALRQVLRRPDRWSWRQLERYQAGALRDLWDFAWRHTPFYRQRLCHRAESSREGRP